MKLRVRCGDRFEMRRMTGRYLAHTVPTTNTSSEGYVYGQLEVYRRRYADRDSTSTTWVHRSSVVPLDAAAHAVFARLDAEIAACYAELRLGELVS